MKHSILVGLLAVVLSGTAQAEFDYTFVNASYGQVDFDDLDVDGDGFGVSASFAVAENYHVFGGVSTADLDFDIDATDWAAGVGFNTPLSEVVDVVAQLSYQRIEFDAPGASADDDGIGIGVGLRVAVSDAVEINGGVTHVNFDDSGDETALGAGFLFNVNEMFSIGVGGSFDDDVTSYNLTGRIYF